LAALRFFYVQVLKRGWSVAETPYPKKVLHLPEILSQEEVARLIDAAEFPFHRILLMTLYATGARRAEVAHLKISDIDKQRMVIHIRGGKGGKDRDVMLSPKLLDALRIWLVAYNAEVLAANSGIRGGEIKQLQLGDINLEARRLRIRRKGTKTDAGARLVELNHSALEALTKLYMRAQTLGAADPNHYLLPADLSRHTKSSDPPRGQLGFDATKHRNSWHSAWRSLLTAAGLEGSDSTICAIHLLRLWPSGAYRCRSCKAWLVT
jgi:integrase